MAIFSSTPRASSGDLGPRRGDGAGLTMIAAGTVVVGDVQSDGVIKIEGEIQGTIRAAAQVLVAKGGVVRGDVLTREAILGGEVFGTVRADDRVEIQAGALVEGDILTLRIQVADGGKVNGQISMSAPSAENGTARDVEPFTIRTADSHNS